MAELTLKQQRILFTRLFSEFVLWCFDNGFDVAYDQVKRTELEAKANAATGAGIAQSVHIDGLAGDLLLYINGDYQQSSEAYAPLGRKWKSMHPLCRWGGDFKIVKKGKTIPKPDGNHFSTEWQGRK